MIIQVLYFFLLLVASIEDYKYHRVRGRWIIAMFLLGVLRLYFEREYRWVTVALACICFLFLYMMYYVVALLAKKYKKRVVFGGADVRLIPAMMLVQGWENALLAVFLGLLLAIFKAFICKEKKKEIPLIPWITLGSIFIKK